MMIPSRQGAHEIGINEKTVKRYYDLLRRGVAAAGENGWFSAGSPLQEKMPVFGFSLLDNIVKVSFPQQHIRDSEPAAPDYLICADNMKALQSLNLDAFHCYSRLRQMGEPALVRTPPDFWMFVKQRLVLYRGGFRKNFPLFVSEMEFRYNNRGNKDAMLMLARMLDSQF